MWGLMIICYFCMVISFFLLMLSGVQGYYQFMILKASHQQFALISAIFYMFTETLVMFYFIGSGSAIKKEILSLRIKTNGYEKVKKTKMKLFPHLTLNMFLIGTVFILGGAVQTGSVSGTVHGVLFYLSFIHFIYVILIQHRGFKENINILIELAGGDQSELISN